MSDQPKLVTGDGCMVESEADLLTRGPFVEIKPDDLMELAKMAGARFDGFVEDAKKIVTPEIAAVVRRLRVDEGYSWRAVAQSICDLTGGDWSPPSNQLMGMALCEVAAESFGERYMFEPWN